MDRAQAGFRAQVGFLARSRNQSEAVGNASVAAESPLPTLWLKQARGSTSHHREGLGGKQPDSRATHTPGLFSDDWGQEGHWEGMVSESRSVRTLGWQN